MDKLKFTAEVKKVSSKKLASLDIEYQIVLSTNDPSVLSLGAVDGSTLLSVEVTPENG